MRLKPNWMAIVKKAWSVRLMTIAAVFTGLESIVPYIGSFLSDGLMAGIAFVAVVGAFLSRLIIQKDLHDDDTTK